MIHRSPFVAIAASCALALLLIGPQGAAGEPAETPNLVKADVSAADESAPTAGSDAFEGELFKALEGTSVGSHLDGVRAFSREVLPNATRAADGFQRPT